VTADHIACARWFTALGGTLLFFDLKARDGGE